MCRGRSGSAAGSASAAGIGAGEQGCDGCRLYCAGQEVGSPVRYCQYVNVKMYDLYDTEAGARNRSWSLQDSNSC
jgi:hypothetical protein